MDGKIKKLNGSEEINTSGGYSGSYGIVVANKDDLKELGVELKPYLVVNKNSWPLAEVVRSYDSFEEALKDIVESQEDYTYIGIAEEGQLKTCLRKRINGTYRLDIPDGEYVG